MLINRQQFRAHPSLPEYEGSVELAGRRYVGHIRSWTGEMNRAWANAERIMSFLLEHYSEIEQKIRTDLVPDMDLWVSEPIGVEDLAQRILEAMSKTDPVRFLIYDTGASSIYFDGPDFVNGHLIEVQFGEGGRLACVGLAG